MKKFRRYLFAKRFTVWDLTLSLLFFLLAPHESHLVGAAVLLIVVVLSAAVESYYEIKDEAEDAAFKTGKQGEAVKVEVPQQYALEDIVVVTNDPNYRVPKDGLCLPYCCAGTDAENAAIKRLICALWRKNAEDKRQDESPLAGIRQGMISLESLASWKISADRASQLGCNLSVADEVTLRHINPIRWVEAVTRGEASVSALAVWGSFIHKDGKLVTQYAKQLSSSRAIRTSVSSLRDLNVAI